MWKVYNGITEIIPQASIFGKKGKRNDPAMTSAKKVEMDPKIIQKKNLVFNVGN